ncbi:MAG: 3-deoxy-7-phosphoheptulonate synthase, partial [Acholeplasmatales bacterium]|nr:3-deoxy-7-phosphoheptulonate synthase [Acholeplasmatales bacterium]
LRLINMYGEDKYKNPSIIVDCNHNNSNKQFLEQTRIAKEVLHSKNHSEIINKYVKGLMIESYLEDGCQKPDGGIYGKSITDPCLGWEKTEKLIREIADILRNN